MYRIVNGTTEPMSDADVADLAAQQRASADPAVPGAVRRRQLLLALKAEGFITADEAVAAARQGALPSILGPLLAGMTPEQQLALEVTWASMTMAERAAPIWASVVAAGIATAEQIDALFIAAKAL